MKTRMLLVVMSALVALGSEAPAAAFRGREEGAGACAGPPLVALNRLHQSYGRRLVVPSGLGAHAHVLGGNGDQHVDLPTVLFIG